MNRPNQRQINKIGWFTTLIVVLSIGISVYIGLFLRDIDIGYQLLLVRVVYILPLAIYITVAKGGVLKKELRLISVKSMTLTIIATVFASPAAIFINLLSQKLTTNTVADSADTLITGNMALVALSICLLAPILEEFCYRGVIYGSYKEYAPQAKAIFVSALLFGLMHMNFNQFCYAFAMGIVFCLINIASGSLISSITAHICLNSLNYIMLDFASINGPNEPSMEVDLSILIAVSFLVMMICLPVFYMFLNKLAKSEGREELTQALFKKTATEGRILFNIPTLIGVAICISVMLI